MMRFNNVASFVALSWAAFQIYVVYGVINFAIAVPIHVTFAIVLSFIVSPLAPDANGAWRVGLRMIDYLLAICAISIALYFIVNEARITTRIPGVDPLETSDYIVG